MRVVFSEDDSEECSIRSNNRYIRGGAFTPAERCEYLDLWNQLSKKIPTTKTDKDIVARLVSYLVREVKAAIVAKELDETTIASLLAEVDDIQTGFGEENTTILSLNAISLQYSILFTKLVMPIDKDDFDEITTFYKDITDYREKCVEFFEVVENKYNVIDEKVRAFFEIERDTTDTDFLNLLNKTTGEEFSEINRKMIKQSIDNDATIISNDNDDYGFISDLRGYIEAKLYNLRNMEGYNPEYYGIVDIRYDPVQDGSKVIEKNVVTQINYQELFLQKKKHYLRYEDIERFLVYPFDTYIDILSRGDDWKDYKNLMNMNIQYDGPYSTYGFSDFFKRDIGILAIDYLTIREMLDSLLTYETPFFYCGLSYDFSITDGIPMNPFTFTYHDLNHVSEYKSYSQRRVEGYGSETVGQVINTIVKPYYKYITGSDFEKDNPDRKKIQYSNYMILFLCLHEHFIREPANFNIFRQNKDKDNKILNYVLTPENFYPGDIFQDMIPTSYRISKETIQEYLTVCKARFLTTQVVFFALPKTSGGRRRKTNKKRRKTGHKRKSYRRSK
jgi:hypothetical protein